MPERQQSGVNNLLWTDFLCSNQKCMQMEAFSQTHVYISRAYSAIFFFRLSCVGFTLWLLIYVYVCTIYLVKLFAYLNGMLMRLCGFADLRICVQTVLTHTGTGSFLSCYCFLRNTPFVTMCSLSALASCWSSKRAQRVVFNYYMWAYEWMYV